MAVYRPRRPKARPKNAADLVGRPWDTTPGRVALGAFAFGTAGFALLLAAVQGGWAPLARLDAFVVERMAGVADTNPSLEYGMRALDVVVGPWVLRVLALVVAIAVFRSGLRRVALWLAGTVVTGAVILRVVKMLVERPRSAVAEVGVTADPYAFPSGHALTAMVVAGALLFVALRRPSWRAYRGWLVGTAATVALLAGLHRIGLVVHQVTDVFGGWFLGLAILGISMLVFGVTRPGHLPRAERQTLHRYRLAVITNPTKIVDELRFRRRVEDLADTHGWEPPLWLDTTLDDPGHEMARVALESNVDLVIAAGGDGTVRAVCSELVGTDVALGIAPVGTGNLLARNLGLPLDHEDAVEVALTGYDRAIDLVRVDGDELDPEWFAVMAGLGLDAAVVAETTPDLKARVGWPAYALSIARNLSFPAVRVEVEIDDQPPLRRRARMVVIGNVGHLHGGVPLLPDATPDDGQLDVVLFAPRRVTQWPGLAWRVLTRSRKEDEQLIHWRGRAVTVRASQAVPRQLDGDLLAPGRELRARVEPSALLVRVPKPEA